MHVQTQKQCLPLCLSQDGGSPVYYASQEGHPDVVDLLVQAGADIHLAETEVHVSTHTQCPLQ